jgi:hypothetical protein
VAQVERDTGEKMRGADGGEANPQGADGTAVIGAADQVQGDGIGIAGQRFAAEAGAPLTKPAQAAR